MNQFLGENNGVISERSTGLIQVDGAQLSYEQARQGHPLIFSQGRSFLGAQVWDDQFLELAQFYHGSLYAYCRCIEEA